MRRGVRIFGRRGAIFKERSCGKKRSRTMQIREMTLRELRMKLVAPFETSAMRTDVRRIVLVEANVDGVMGWGECVAGEAPGDSPGTTGTAWRIVRADG